MKFNLLSGLTCLYLVLFGMGMNNVLSQGNNETIRHIIYSNRLLKRSSIYLDKYDGFQANHSVIISKLYPNYGEYYWIDINLIDSIVLTGYEIYEYKIREKCHSRNDHYLNQFNASDLELNFSDSVFRECSCCMASGNAYDDHIPKIDDCEQTAGIIAVDYPNNSNTPRVYFLSGKCVFLDQFETVFFEKNEPTKENIETILTLKFWNTTIYQSESNFLYLKRKSKKRFDLQLIENNKPIKLKLVGRRKFKLVSK